MQLLTALTSHGARAFDTEPFALLASEVATAHGAAALAQAKATLQAGGRDSASPSRLVDEEAARLIAA